MVDLGKLTRAKCAYQSPRANLIGSALRVPRDDQTSFMTTQQNRISSCESLSIKTNYADIHAKKLKNLQLRFFELGFTFIGDATPR
jgi:hypothetical protein